MKMLPFATSDNVGYLALGYPEALGDDSLDSTLPVQDYDRMDLRGRQFGSMHGLPASGIPAPAALGDHVSDVVGLGPEEEMARIDAERFVAGMKNLDPIRDVPAQTLKRPPVREPALGPSVPTESQAAVSISGTTNPCGGPNPAAPGIDAASRPECSPIPNHRLRHPCTISQGGL